MKFQPTKPITYVIDKNGCHVCTSHRQSGSVIPGKGYPTICIQKVKWRLNRYMYTQNFGKIPEGNVVRHTCDNRMCINPSHLIIGTLGDNNRDRAERGRSRDQSGSRNNMSKLTDSDAIDINNSGLSAKELSDKYGITKNQVWNIRSGKRWKHIRVSESLKKQTKELIEN